MSEYITEDQKHQLLDTAVVRGEFTLASGNKSNEKFDFDRIETGSEQYGFVVSSFTYLIQATIDQNEHEALALVTVATGANRLGDELADNLSMYHVPARKDMDGKLYIPERTEGMTGIVVDDVFTTGFSLESVKREFRGRLMAAYVLLDRSGKVAPTISDGIKVHSVMQHVL